MRCPGVVVIIAEFVTNLDKNFDGIKRLQFFCSRISTKSIYDINNIYSYIYQKRTNQMQIQMLTNNDAKLKVPGCVTLSNVARRDLMAGGGPPE